MFCVGSGRQRAVGVLLVRHEHEVPELEEAVTARARRRAVRLAAAVLLAPVPVELGVRPTRSGAADRPEVLGRRERNDPLARHPDLLPELDRHLVRAELQLRVAGMDRHPHPLPVELHVLLHELARELDRAFLEVLPEREVPEHLEEREVVAVEPDLVDVDGPEDLLRQGRQRRGRRLETEEERHLRLHSRGDEERRVVACARHERVRRAAEMASFLEEREIALTQLGGRAHPGILRARSRAPGAATRPEADPQATTGRRCAAPRRPRSRVVRRHPSRRVPPRPRRAASGTPRTRARRPRRSR